MNLPIIRLEVEGMREAIMLALTERELSMDAYVQAELDRFCSSGNIQAVVAVQVKQALSAAIERSVKSFFDYGDGHAVVRTAVLEGLAASLPEIMKGAADDRP